MASSRSLRQIYLLAYNSKCGLLWLHILIRTLSTLLSSDFSAVYTNVEPWTRFTQTIAIAEIIHAATGITRSPVMNTFAQVYARSVQAWAINYAFPSTTAPSPTYPAMILAWSVADVFRYFYFAVKLSGLPVPGLLTFMRYSLFIILYPVGISTEMWLMYKATTVSNVLAVKGLYYFFLGLYAPGSVMMYSYMLKQRRKALR